jgi:hypothetical protein
MLAIQTFCRFTLYLTCAATAALCAGGCTTAAVVSAGTVAGIAASAVSTGAEVYRLGKLDSADEARFDEWIAAVQAAAADLHLDIERESDNGKGLYRCTLRDERRSKINVIVERRTETLCRTRIDVGWFGSEPTARLILARIRLYEDLTSPDTGDEGLLPEALLHEERRGASVQHGLRAADVALEAGGSR